MGGGVNKERLVRLVGEAGIGSGIGVSTLGYVREGLVGSGPISDVVIRTGVTTAVVAAGVRVGVGLYKRVRVARSEHNSEKLKR